MIEVFSEASEHPLALILHSLIGHNDGFELVNNRSIAPPNDGDAFILE